MKQKWDIFCKIVDNFGDIGVCWRLSKQLSTEYGLQVRLWVDDLAVAKKLIANLDINTASQLIQDIEICHWTDDFKAATVADVVIEAFGCEPPAIYLAAMAVKKPVWINLEYLSAEQWVDDFHAKSSPHPASGLTRYFFFPGFTEQTGGLIREQGLLAARNDFQNSASAQQAFLHGLHIADDNALKVSLFAYPHAPVASLLDCLKASSRPVVCLVPESSISTAISAYFGKQKIQPGESVASGNVRLQLIPFLTQQDYDKLLWACDINFVRGEDSWVRAVWAGKPFIWQPYLQQEDTHITKLTAFLDRYYSTLSAAAKAAVYACHLDWCKQQLTQQHWENILGNLPALQAHHIEQLEQLEQLASQPDLAAKLVIFCQNRL
ncbi:MAG: elongation factor P maturation arginine rhamnosyltransferase EarP [Candidatus Methylopumilus sp.]